MNNNKQNLTYEQVIEHFLTLENIEDKLKNKNVIIDFYATW